MICAISPREVSGFPSTTTIQCHSIHRTVGLRLCWVCSRRVTVLGGTCQLATAHLRPVAGCPMWRCILCREAGEHYLSKAMNLRLAPGLAAAYSQAILMRSKWRWLAVVVLALMTHVPALRSAPKEVAEPRHAGHPLSYWVLVDQETLRWALCLQGLRAHRACQSRHERRWHQRHSVSPRVGSRRAWAPTGLRFRGAWSRGSPRHPGVDTHSN